MADVQHTRAFACEAIPTSPLQCELCRSPFTARGRGRTAKRFCSDVCRSRAETRRYRVPVASICVGCSLEFHPKKSDRTTYCSRECSFKSKARQPPKVRHCKHCAAPLQKGRKLFCSDECSERLVSLKRTRCCKVCQSSIKVVGNEWQRFCGSECRELWRKQTAPLRIATRRKAKQVRRTKYGKGWRKRCRVLALAYEPVNVTVVFDRDRWCCQICGKRTPQSRRGSLTDNAPTLDHRIPLSKGGGHLYSNVQCACRKCNTTKGNRSFIGQTSLFDNPLKYLNGGGTGRNLNE